MVNLAALWLISLLVGFSITNLSWLFFIQDSVPGKAGMGIAACLLAVSTFIASYVAKRWILPKASSEKPIRRYILLALTTAIGIWVAYGLSRDLPVNRLLLQKHSLMIAVEAENNPASSGNKVELVWFTTSLGDISFKQLKQEGLWERTDLGIINSGGGKASLSWRGKTADQATLVFNGSTDAGRITVTWDGKAQALDLYADEAREFKVEQVFKKPILNRLIGWFSLSVLISFLGYLLLIYSLPLLMGQVVIYLNDISMNIRVEPSQTNAIDKNKTYKTLYLSTIFSIFIYVLMEGLFLVTKPSFMGILSLSKKMEILLFAASFATVSGLLIIIFAALLFRLQIIPADLKRIFLTALFLLPSVVFASMVLLLIDNFTYTLFGIGILTATGFFRALYALLFLYFVATFIKDLLHFSKINHKFLSGAFQRKLLAGLVAFVCLSLLIPVIINNRRGSDSLDMGVSASSTPSIIWITADGLNASHMSAYGYKRSTTPRIEELSRSSLMAENAFPNSSKTYGSVTSLFTSKHPLKTRVLFSPDILRGQDAYEHLAGVLRKAGYTNIQLGVPYFVDAFTVNILDGFDLANGRTLQNNLFNSLLARYLSHDHSYFIFELSNRIITRLEHIFFIQEHQNPFDIVTESAQVYIDDNKKQELILQVTNAKEPLFIHLHYMGTHGARFYPKVRHFSAGKDLTQQERYDPDFYDDSILDFDSYVGQIIDELNHLGKFEKTLLIIGTDHGMGFDTKIRIPVIIHFPKNEHAGTVAVNTQNLDIAPTILDYLGITIPDWMEGNSLLNRLDQRPIIITGKPEYERDEKGRWIVNQKDLAAPFFQFKTIGIIYCQQWYELDLDKLSMETGIITDHTHPCPPGSLHQKEQYFSWMLETLQQNGFDTKTLINGLKWPVEQD